MKSKQSWNEKLNDAKDLPRVQPMADRMIPKWRNGTMVLPAPVEVDQLSCSVPKGKATGL